VDDQARGWSYLVVQWIEDVQFTGVFGVEPMG